MTPQVESFVVLQVSSQPSSSASQLISSASIYKLSATLLFKNETFTFR